MYERCSFLNENNSHNFPMKPEQRRCIDDGWMEDDGLFQECSGRVDCEMNCLLQVPGVPPTWSLSPRAPLKNE